MGNNSRNAPRPDYSRIDPTYRRGLLGFAGEDPAQFAKGMVVGNEAGLLDLLGMGANVFSRGMTGQPVFDQAMGNPLRESFGIDPQSAQSVAGEVLSPGGLLGAFAKAAGKGGLLAAPFFHGTPHKWKGGRPSLEFVGTGEGAQAYGHGLYFAENPGVAGSYRDQLSGWKITVDGSEVPDLDLRRHKQLLKEASEGRLDEYVSNARNELDNAASQSNALARMRKEDLAFAESIKGKKVEVDKGHLYEVDIPDQVVDKMLDWDRPIGKELEAMLEKDGLGGFIFSNSTGKNLYRYLSNKMGDIKASQWLHDRGIPGIRYWDGASRYSAKGSGPVIERAARLMEKNGDYKETAKILKKEYPFLKDNVLTQEYLEKALENKATRNIVVFDPDSSIRKVKKDGQLVFERVD